MTLDDEARPQVASRPAWAEAPNIVVPTLQLTSQGEGAYLVQFMFPSRLGPNAFSWVGKNFEVGPELNAFLLEWWESPEDCVRKHFALEPPKGKVWTFARSAEIDGEIESEISAEDLGL